MMALDEPKENDEVFEVEEVTYLVDGELLKQTGKIKLDFVETFFGAGFVLTPENAFAGASACGSSCTC